MTTPPATQALLDARSALTAPVPYLAVPCYCACSLAHPATLGVCDAERPETTRTVAGIAVLMCLPCAAAHDARPPRSWA